MRRTVLLPAALLFGTLVILTSSCAPLRQGATESSFYSSGRLDMNITVNPPLTLAATGQEWANVPSDVNLHPLTGLKFAVFAEGSEGPVARHAHAFVCTLPQSGWRWAMETWPSKSTLMLTKMRYSGKFWTVQIHPIQSGKDWFCMLWTTNGRSVPEAWLAKRWSATPYIDTRIVAEYREPASECVRSVLADVKTDSRGQAQPPDDKTILELCRNDVDAFSRRADTVFQLDRMEAEAPAVSITRQLVRPHIPPDIKALAGEAELLSRDGGYSSE